MTIETLARSDPMGQTPHDDAPQPRWVYPHSVVPGDLGTHTGDPLNLVLEPTGRTFDPTGHGVSRLLQPNVFDGIHPSLRSPATERLIAGPIQRVIAAGRRPMWMITTDEAPDEVDSESDDGQSAFRTFTSVTPAGIELYRRIAPATPLFLFAHSSGDDTAGDAGDTAGDTAGDSDDDSAGDVRVQFTARAAHAYADAVRGVERALPVSFDGTLPDTEWQNTPVHVAYFGLTSALILLGRTNEARTVSEAHLMLWPERLITEWLAFHARLQPEDPDGGGFT